jgi:Listeria-Bacteroides repeat domain (List_Bact_rpt).
MKSFFYGKFKTVMCFMLVLAMGVGMLPMATREAKAASKIVNVTYVAGDDATIKGNKTFTVTYETDNGKITITRYEAEKKSVNYVFKGWSKTKGSKIDYKPGETITLSTIKDFALYAVFSYCPHAHKKSTVLRSATCYQTGTKEYVCSDCGKKWTESTPKTGHQYKKVVVTTDYVKYCELHCAVCNARAFNVARNLNQFSQYIYAKDYSALSSKQQLEVKQKWTSYTLGCNMDKAKELAKKDYKDASKIKITNIDSLISFATKVEGVFSELDLGKNSVLSAIGTLLYVDVLRNPKSTKTDVLFATLSQISPIAGIIIDGFTKVSDKLTDLCFMGYESVAENGLMTDIGRLHIIDVSYNGLFNKTMKYKGATRRCIDVICLEFAEKDFVELGKSKVNSDIINFKSVMKFLVLPALDKEVAGCIDECNTFEEFNDILKTIK